MPKFEMVEILTYYDGVQLAFMNFSGSSALDYIAAQSLDDGVFLASKISIQQRKDLCAGLIDVKTVMQNPHEGEMYLVLDAGLLPMNQQQRLRLDQYYSIPVKYDPIFDEWAIPSDGLFLTDI